MGIRSLHVNKYQYLLIQGVKHTLHSIQFSNIKMVKNGSS